MHIYPYPRDRRSGRLAGLGLLLVGCLGASAWAQEAQPVAPVEAPAAPAEAPAALERRAQAAEAIRPAQKVAPPAARAEAPQDPGVAAEAKPALADPLDKAAARQPAQAQRRHPMPAQAEAAAEAQAVPAPAPEAKGEIKIELGGQGQAIMRVAPGAAIQLGPAMEAFARHKLQLNANGQPQALTIIQNDAEVAAAKAQKYDVPELAELTVPPATPAELTALVQQLGADKHAQREAAELRLRQEARRQPDPVLAAILPAYRRNDDPESQLRQELVLRELQVILSQRTGRGYMGLQLNEMQEELTVDGQVFLPLVITAAVENSPAATAGVQNGDLLLQVDDKPLRPGFGMAECIAYVQARGPEREVALRVWRAGAAQTCRFKLARMPEDLAKQAAARSGGDDFRGWLREKLKE